MPTVQGGVWYVCFVQDGTQLATAGEDGKIRYWSTADGSPVGEPIDAHEGFVRQLACNKDGSRLASTGEDGRVLLWRAGATMPEAELLAANEWWPNVAFSRDSAYVAFTSQPEDSLTSINVWDVNEGKRVRDFPIIQTLSDATLSRDGLRVAAGGDAGQMVVWDTATGETLVNEWFPSTEGISSLAFSPNGSLVAVGGDDGSV